MGGNQSTPDHPPTTGGGGPRQGDEPYQINIKDDLIINLAKLQEAQGIKGGQPQQQPFNLQSWREKNGGVQKELDDKVRALNSEARNLIADLSERTTALSETAFMKNSKIEREDTSPCGELEKKVVRCLESNDLDNVKRVMVELKECVVKEAKEKQHTI